VIRLPLSVRRALAPIVRPISVRIASGPNQGARWSRAIAAIYRPGTFESARVSTILSLLRPGDCFWDLGAHYGYVSLAASRVVGSEGHVYSFEASPYNYGYLKHHMEWNGASNVTPVARGVWREAGWVEFGGTGGSQTFSIGGGRERIQVTSLEAMMASGIRAPDVVKIDVEGAEGAILETGARFLPKSATVIVSIHSADNYALCVGALQREGFSIFLSEDLKTVSERPRWGDDPDLIALGPASRASARDLAAHGFTPCPFR
jgi:FkbM family methyltransferase